MAKATKKEIQERVDHIIKLMTLGVRSTDIQENATVKSWGVSTSRIWVYISRALEYFKTKANINRDGELGKILEQYDFLYIQALKSEDYRLCVTILDKRAELIGLKTFRLDAEMKIKIENVPEDLDKDAMV